MAAVSVVVVDAFVYDVGCRGKCVALCTEVRRDLDSSSVTLPVPFEVGFSLKLRLKFP